MDEWNQAPRSPEPEPHEPAAAEARGGGTPEPASDAPAGAPSGGAPTGTAADAPAGARAAATPWPRPADPFAGATQFVPAGADARRGLAGWLVVLLVLGVGGLVAGQGEAAVLVALAGIYVAAQAADLDPRWRLLHWLVAWVVPVGAVATFAFVSRLATPDLFDAPARLALLVYCTLAAALCLALAWRPVVDPVAVRMFREDPPSRALRLTTRLAVAGLLFAIPGSLLVGGQVAEISDRAGGLVTRSSLAGQLVGMIVVALAGVGFLVRRGFRATVARLGLEPIRSRHLLIALLGAVVLFALNAAAETAQRRWFPGLWAQDQAANEVITKGLGVAEALLLGVSAGVGEELTMRGALQPRLGVVLTAALFASLHVQYSWYGMLVVFLIGATLGVLRARTSTSVAILVHAVYDVLAVLAS